MDKSKHNVVERHHILRWAAMAILAVLLTGCTDDRSSGDAALLADLPMVEGLTPPAVEVSIAGSPPVVFVLDTGADPSVVDVTWAKQMGWRLERGTGQLRGSGNGTTEHYLTLLPSVRLGQVDQRDVFAAALDLSSVSKSLGKEIRGILGYSFLKDRIVQFDFPGKRLRLYATAEGWRRSKQFESGQHETLPFTFAPGENTPHMVAGVNGQPCRALLDTGNDVPFRLAQTTALKLGVTLVGRDDQHHAFGVLGHFEFHNGRANEVRIGNLVRVDAPINIPGDSSIGNDNRLNVGLGFMKDYVVTFDYQKLEVDFQKCDAVRSATSRPDAKESTTFPGDAPCLHSDRLTD